MNRAYNLKNTTKILSNQRQGENVANKMNYTNKNIFILLIFILDCIDLSWETCDDDVPSRRVPKQWAYSVVMFTNCQAGTYKSLADGQCLPCPGGYFMTEKMAARGVYAFCEKCYEASQHELIFEECTKSRDSLVHCQAGYYRRRDPSKPHCKCCWECTPCDVCGGADKNTTYEKRSCNAHHNRVCCPNNDMVVLYDACVVPENKVFQQQSLIGGFNSCCINQIHTILLVICCCIIFYFVGYR